MPDQTLSQTAKCQKQTTDDPLRDPPSCSTVDKTLTPRVLALCHQGKKADAISRATGLSVDEVQKIIDEAAQRSRILYVFMDREVPATIIDVCGITQSIRIVNLTDDLLSRAFGIRENPDWNDYEEFLESRCMPRTRYGIREELREMGIDTYDPFLIVEKTAGRVHGDGQWLRRMSPEWVTEYDTILESVPDEKELCERLLEFLRKDSGGAENEENGT